MLTPYWIEIQTRLTDLFNKLLYGKKRKSLVKWKRWKFHFCNFLAEWQVVLPSCHLNKISNDDSYLLNPAGSPSSGFSFTVARTTCTSLMRDSSWSRRESSSCLSSLRFNLLCNSCSVSFNASSMLIWHSIFSSASLRPRSNRLKLSSNWFTLTLDSRSPLSAYKNGQIAKPVMLPGNFPLISASNKWPCTILYKHSVMFNVIQSFGLEICIW